MVCGLLKNPHTCSQNGISIELFSLDYDGMRGEKKRLRMTEKEIKVK
jgi:hypothetical protein